MSKTLTKLTRKTQYAGAALAASSFRSGIPTDMESRPDLFQDTQIKSWGRWRSRAYRCYLKNEPARRREIFSRLSGMLMKEI